MHLSWLNVRNIRNLTNVEIEPSPGLNFFIGPNASGKTSLLEAIYLLTRARSFRSPRIGDVIQHDRDSLLVAAKVNYNRQGVNGKIHTGIEKSRGKTTIHYNGEKTKTVSEQARRLPLILITPDTHEIISGTPKQRRNWLDWAMFHVEHDYLPLWRSYHKSLRQRNALLKNGKLNSELMEGWELALARDGEKIRELRERFLDRIAAAICRQQKPSQLTSMPNLKLNWGWPEGRRLKEVLAADRIHDYQSGTTRSGPHRGDIAFTVNDRPVASIFSRGQIKLFVAMVLMAQSEVLQALTGEIPLFMVDDFAAELDADSRGRLVTQLLERHNQIFLTSTEPDRALPGWESATLFHVEHGEFNKK